ncbi:MAG: transcription antitermination factor NusB [Acidimicrobiia bacterium]|nr:transcription antitermination factor NusB [Acidimicrobiia bacterium]
MTTNTRAIAARTLLRITDEGAFSNVLLPHATAHLAPVDAGFVYHLVTQALRRIREVDEVIEDVARPLAEIDADVRAVLQIAVAEIIAGDRSEVHATVNEAVEAVKHLGSPRAAGFVNAVLRRVVREGAGAGDRDPATEYAVPDWLFARLATDHGDAEARAMLTGLRAAGPPTGVRVRPDGAAPDKSRAVDGIAGAYHLTGRIRTSRALAVADPASTAVGLAVGARSGEAILDMAAAPGGKTLHLWDQSGGGARIVALDRHARRLRSARRRLAAVGAHPHWIQGDARRAPISDSAFDAVLLDAPCTGMGTLRRRPEIAMRLEPSAPERLAGQQHAMLAEAWRVVRPGGRIIYSVCTVFAAETIDVIAGYPAQPPPGLPGKRWGNGLLLAPNLTDTDGMFISLIRRPQR